MRITFLGAARMVTGSSFLLEHDGFSILVDLGLAQGNDEDRMGDGLPFDAGSIDAVILTHAHIDHSGRLPLLAKEGYTGPVYATEATIRLSSIMLLDSAHIQESDAAWKSRRSAREGGLKVEPLYTSDDANAVMELFQSVPYCQRIFLRDDISFMMIDAGHLLGSASVKIFFSEGGKEKSIVFSGDIGNSDQPMLRNPEYFDSADWAVMESTYGDRLHDKPEGDEKEVLYKRAQELAEITDRTFRRGGNLIIPSFAVGRTQEILYLFRIIMDRGLLPYEVPVFVDSPLSVKATAVFASCLRDDYFDDEARAMIEKGINPILFPSLTAVIDAEESKKLNLRKESAVIISSSGMCEAGRIRHHLKHNLWRSDSTILFVGYQAEGTLGREIVDGAESVHLFGEEIMVNAEIAILRGTSGHADKNGLVEWASAFTSRPQGIFVVHGESSTADYFASMISSRLGVRAYAPDLGESFVFGDEFPEEGTAPLRRHSADMLRPRLEELEMAKNELDGIFSRLRKRADAADLSDERESERLGRAIKRLSDELSEINRRWNKKHD